MEAVGEAHPREQIRSGTLRRFIADAGLTVEQFVGLLGG